MSDTRVLQKVPGGGSRYKFGDRQFSANDDTHARQGVQKILREERQTAEERQLVRAKKELEDDDVRHRHADLMSVANERDALVTENKALKDELAAVKKKGAK